MSECLGFFFLMHLKFLCFSGLYLSSVRYVYTHIRQSPFQLLEAYTLVLVIFMKQKQRYCKYFLHVALNMAWLTC